MRTSTPDKEVQQNRRIQNYLKSVAFLYINDKQAEKEFGEVTLFTMTPNIIKYHNETHTKIVKDLMDKNFTSLKRRNEKGREEIHLAAEMQKLTYASISNLVC